MREVIPLSFPLVKIGLMIVLSSFQVSPLRLVAMSMVSLLMGLAVLRLTVLRSVKWSKSLMVMALMSSRSVTRRWRALKA